ncbi:indole-3-glycerol phosphate synthase TrpC [Desulfurobacterium atlanticum]|uniref:Indole-3-glycerol phosphate synthase n=1 Tax=Desulfurobacterium atlanticum TaxID=240169 RepID=A0A238YUB9_9BACT|nr:indole-3-glycerol phosphate synthase TrpC [Desulfurobacterium atlanticum]SNR74660.1 indole-3-glycerol phosphate synthase [Desulfurobacterium atlanticum]
MNILKKIVEFKKAEVEKRKKEIKFEAVKKIAETSETPFNFKKVFPNDRINIIAEVKKASPSKGVICKNFNYIEIAKAYEKGGAAAISVLTDVEFFKGSPLYLKEIAETVKLPVLRKDFIIDPFQIYAAKALGASSFLLIAAILDKQTLADFISLGRDLGMEPLVETHTEEEIRKSLDAGAAIVGINNRNLENFTVSLSTSIKLAPIIKDAGKICISESGIKSKEDIVKLKTAGVDGFLIGETLMRSSNPEEMLRKWIEN